MMDEYIAAMRDPHEIEKIRKIMEDVRQQQGVAVNVAPAKPAIVKSATTRRLSAIAEGGHESDEDDKDTGRK
jgi:hypothetical protein